MNKQMFLEFDLAGAEWVVTAYCANDAKMIEVVNSPKSPHVITASLIFHVPEPLVEKENKLIGNLNDPDKIKTLRLAEMPELFDLPGAFLPRSMSLRQAGKKSNHGLNYFLRYRNFALRNEMDEADAKYIVESYSNIAYPGLELTYWAGVRDQLRKNRTLTNLLGSKRRFLGEWGVELFQAAYSYIPQSTVGNIVNDGLILAYEDERPEFAPADMLAQVHDSALFQYPTRDFEQMALFADGMHKHLKPELHTNGHDFSINVDLKVGFKWGKQIEIKLDQPVDALAQALEAAAIQLAA